MDQQFVEKYFDFESDSENIVQSTEGSTANQLTQERVVFLKESSAVEQKIFCQYLQFNDIIKIDNQSTILEAMKLKKTYQCDLCDQSFTSGCALGGHRSKVHSQNGKKKYNKMKDLFNKSEEQEQRALYLKELKRNKIS